MNNTKHLNHLNEAIKELQNILVESKAEKFSQLEIDLALDKLKQMYDIVLQIKATATGDRKTAPVKVEQPLFEEQNQAQPSLLDEGEANEKNPDLKTMKQEESIDSPIFEIETSEPNTPASEQLMEEEIPTKEMRTEKKTEEMKGDVLDLFNENESVDEPDVATLDKSALLEKEKETVADRLQKSKLVSIKSGIGINEKFFFLNELFRGDLQVYNDHIEELDSQKTLDEALLLLKEQAESLKWDSESEAFIQLAQMIEKKFS